MTRVIVKVDGREYAGVRTAKDNGDGTTYVRLDNGSAASFPLSTIRDEGPESDAETKGATWPPVGLETKHA